MDPHENEAELGFEDLRGRHDSHWDALRPSYRPTEPDWGSLYLSYGFPMLSIQASQVPEHCATWKRGDAREEWGPVTLGDGSDQGPSVPEFRRAGWSVVQ